MWPQFEPSVIKIESGSNFFYNIRPIEYVFQGGVNNSESCWKKHIEEMSCPIKCALVSNAGLPICQSTDDIACIYKHSRELNLWTMCSMKNRALTYNGDLTKWDKYEQDNATYLNIDISNSTVEIREEVYFITIEGLIGSLGGSLGMFFGFSIFGYILYLVDKFFAKLVQSDQSYN